MRGGLKIEGEAEVRAELRRRLAVRGAAKQLAYQLDVPPELISMVKHGIRHPTPQMAEALGFRRVIRFERVE